jgi:exopolysaccharide biosynthesis polyprenyl glycosylphosphotransferase
VRSLKEPLHSPFSLLRRPTAGALAHEGLARGARAPQGRLPLHLSERKVLLFAGDILALALSLVTVLHWRLGMPFGWATLAAHPTWFILLAALWCVVAPLFNAYDLPSAARRGFGLKGPVAAATLVAGIYLFIPFITPQLNTSRLTALSFVVGTVSLVVLCRSLYAFLLVKPTFRHTALIVGAGWAGETLWDAIRLHAPTEYDVIGYVDDDPDKQERRVRGLPVLGTRRDLLKWVVRAGVSEVIIAITNHDAMDGELVQALMDCHEQGVKVTTMAALYERLTGKVPIEHVGRRLHVLLPLDREGSLAYPLLKRAMDLAMGVLGAVVFLALLPLVGAAILLEDGRPVLFRQRRLGRGGRPFMLLKFRTMRVDAEAEGPRWAEEADERVTRVGRTLRRLHLDELPQALNLLRGEMSFTGPRPERPEFVEELQEQIPFYRTRHAVRPGITGWAQVNYKYGSSVEDALVKLQYDLYYIKHCSLFLDLLILVRTLRLVLSLNGR